MIDVLSARPHASRVSTDVSKYLLLDRIAVGGMAEVYRAKSLGVEGFEKIIAIKRILPSLAQDDDFVEMFIEEAKIAGQLSHANIAPIYELGKIDGTHFIAMQYVWGKDLLQIIERHRNMRRTVEPMMAAWIIARVLEGLDYAHRKRGPNGQPLAIIHRDVSPQNVIVSYDGLVKVIDFGIAKAASRATQTQAGVVKGKLGYMSPEQITGLPLDHRSDIFATSTCFHEMLTCQRLFTGRNDIEVIDKVRQAKAPRPSELGIEVPPALEAVLMKGLARDPNERWSTAGEMHDALMPIIATTRPVFGTARLGDWMRTAFAQEIAEEKAHLDRLGGVASAGQKVKERPAPPAPPPLMGFDDADDEPTVMSESPFAGMAAHGLDYGAPSVAKDRDGVEVSVLVTVDDVSRLADPSAGFDGGAALEASTRPMRAERPPTPSAPDPFAPLPSSPRDHGPSPSNAFAPAPSPAYPSGGFDVPPRDPSYPQTDVLGLPPGGGPMAPTASPSRPPPPMHAPQIPAAALSNRPPPPAPAPATSNRFFTCLVLVLLLGVLVAGTAIGFWFTGGDALIRQRFPEVDRALSR